MSLEEVYRDQEQILRHHQANDVSGIHKITQSFHPVSIVPGNAKKDPVQVLAVDEFFMGGRTPVNERLPHFSYDVGSKYRVLISLDDYSNLVEHPVDLKSAVAAIRPVSSVFELRDRILEGKHPVDVDVQIPHNVETSMFFRFYGFKMRGFTKVLPADAFDIEGAIDDFFGVFDYNVPRLLHGEHQMRVTQDILAGLRQFVSTGRIAEYSSPSEIESMLKNLY